MDLSLRTMEYLVAVVDQGRFTRAAEVLHVSVPALSKQIRKLEDQLQLTLLDRSVAPIRPTADGAEIVEAARAVLAAAEHTRSVAGAVARRRAGRLRVGFVLAFAGPLTEPILTELAAARPELAVDLVELDLNEPVDAVLRHTVDAAFVRAPARADDRVRLDHVLDEERVVALSSRHRLADRAEVPVAELAAEPCLRLDDVAPEFSRWWAVDPRPDGRLPTYGPSGHTITEFAEHVARGSAVFFTTRSLAAHISRPDIVFRPVPDIPRSRLYLCTRTRDRSPGVAALRDALRRVTTT